MDSSKLVLVSNVLVFAVVIGVAISVQTCVAQNAPQDFLNPHNTARGQVGVASMQWNAQSYANQRIADCQLVHSGGPYGENIFWGYGLEYAAADAVNSWVGEKQYYDYGTNNCAAGQVCGHYTQVVWRSSVQLGCARVKCNSGAVFITCNYYPRGNFVGQRPY